MTNNPYGRLPGSDSTDGNGGIPQLPPSYDESNVQNGSGSMVWDDAESATESNNINMEQFDIEDEDFDPDTPTTSVFARASFFSKKMASDLGSRLFSPVTRIIDPMYEGLQFVNSQYERGILKIGNPLVVKRLLYVAFMVGIIYFVTKYSVNDGINGTSGGAFSSGKFYDIEKLAEIIDEHIDQKTMKETLEYFSSMPHMAGTSGDLTIGKYIETHMKNNGVQNVGNVELQSFINYPSTDKEKTKVETVDGSFKAVLNEMGKEDMQYFGYNPNALKTDSEVQGHMIYVNHGTEEDFKKLEDAKIDLKGCVLLIRYGGSIPEGNTVVLAAEKDVKAIVFITPKFTIGKEDKKEVHDDVIQRSNVGNIRYSPGDVLTPGWSSDEGFGSRLLWFKSKSTPKVPTIPISYKDGMTLIAKLGEKGYKFDHDLYSGEKTSDAATTLKVAIGNTQKENNKIWNVVGSIPGREQHDKTIIIGAARDSSCFGTMESNTGTVILLELIKIFTTMQRKFNWSPARTITFISFDATNYNLAGVTEWVEEKRSALQEQAYAYIDLSDAVAGDELSIKANPFLHTIIKDCLKKVGSSTIQAKRDEDITEEDNLAERDTKLPKVHHKDKSMSLYDLFKLSHNGDDKISNNMIENKNYIPFINMLNVPSVEIKFKGNKYPQQSCYDNFENFERSKIDPSMKKHTQLVELLGRLILNVAETPFIPFKLGEFVDNLFNYENDLEKYINEVVRSDNRPNKPQMHFDKIVRSLNTLREAARELDTWVDSCNKYIEQSADMESSLLAMKRWKWNECLVEFNNRFIDTNPHPARPGYVNVLFGIPKGAPSVDDNKWQWNTFPTIRDFIEKGDYGRAQYEIERLSSLIESSARFAY